MKKWLISLVAVPMLLVGCNNEPEVDTLDSGHMPEAIATVIETPEQVDVNKEIELIATVTEGDKRADDADVQFEVWESGLRDDGHMIEAKLDKDGVYKATFTFDHDGVYYMYAHTTVGSLHVMPKQQITAGNPDLSKVLEDKSDNNMNHGDMDEDEEEEHH